MPTTKATFLRASEDLQKLATQFEGLLLLAAKLKELGGIAQAEESLSLNVERLKREQSALQAGIEERAQRAVEARTKATVTTAEVKAKGIVSDAEAKAAELVRNAKAEADRIVAVARKDAAELAARVRQAQQHVADVMR